jgi:hypothetical protein
MTESIYAYAKERLTWGIGEDVDAKLWLYNGTFPSNIGSNNLLGDLDIATATPADIFKPVSDLIIRVPKRNTSEAMISCMYYALADIYANVVSKQEIGVGWLKGVNFVVCTDESIFTSDTLDQYSNVKNKATFSWFKNWQTKATNKFPSTLSGYSNKKGH